MNGGWTTRTLSLFVWPLIGVGLAIGAWSIATPLGMGPDEPTHSIQAAAVVRGQFDGPQAQVHWGVVPIGHEGLVRIPTWVVNVPRMGVPVCAERRTAEPTCVMVGVPPGGVPGRATATFLTATQFSKNPPLYYLIVGTPTLLASGTGALYAMRYTGAVLDFLLIALGLFLLARYHPRRLTLFGSMVALSPMVLYVSSVVGSSGLETAAAFAAWCAGLCVVARDDTPRMLVVLTSLSFVVLILSRPLSPIIAGVIVVVLATSIGWPRTRALLLQRSCRPIWVSIVAATAAAGIFLAIVGIPSVLGAGVRPRVSLFAAVELTLRNTGHRLRDLVGDLVWGRVYTPTWVVVVWVLVLGGLFVWGLVASRGFRRALPLLVFAIIAMPVVFESPQMNTVGPYWQGRYWLPLAVGLPLVAAAVQPRRAPQRSEWALSPSARFTGLGIIGAVLIGAQVASFWAALHYYEDVATVRWTPPGGTALVLGMFAAGQLLIWGFVLWAYRRPTRRDSTVPQLVAHSPDHRLVSV